MARVGLHGDGDGWRAVDGSTVTSEDLAWEVCSGSSLDTCAVLVAEMGLLREDSCDISRPPICSIYVGGNLMPDSIKWKGVGVRLVKIDA